MKKANIALIITITFMLLWLQPAHSCLRVPMKNDYKDVAKVMSPGIEAGIINFNPLKIYDYEWKKRKSSFYQKVNDWFLNRDYEDLVYNGLNFYSIFKGKLPYSRFLAGPITEIDKIREVSEQREYDTKCTKWVCAVYYVLKDMDFIEDIKVMRTKDDQHTWLAVKLNGYGWYAFDRTIAQFEIYKYLSEGVFTPLSTIFFHSEEYSVEYVFSDIESVLERASKKQSVKKRLIEIRESLKSEVQKSYKQAEFDLGGIRRARIAI